MSDHSVQGRLATQRVDQGDVDEAIGRLDQLAGDPDLDAADRTRLERMALQLAIEHRRAREAWRRYRFLAVRSAAGPAVLAGHVAALGELALEMEDDGALSRARTELSRLIAVTREQPDSGQGEQADWPGFVDLLQTWDRPDVLRAERAFEARVQAWLAAGGAGRPRLRETLETMAAEARLPVADGAADIAIDGRRAFWALSILAAGRNDLEAAWVQYAASANNMDPAVRAAGLLVIARAIDPHHVQANLLIPVSRELDRLAREWPEPASLAEARARDALRPEIAELAERLRPD